MDLRIMVVCRRSPGTSWFFQNLTSKQAPPFQPSNFRPPRPCGGLQIGLVLGGPERPQSGPSCPGKQLNQPLRPIGHTRATTRHPMALRGPSRRHLGHDHPPTAPPPAHRATTTRATQKENRALRPPNAHLSVPRARRMHLGRVLGSPGYSDVS